MQIEGMKFQVLAVDGDNHLGGRNFDGVLEDHWIAHFEKTKPTIRKALEANKGELMAQLTVNCNSAKEELSESTTTDVSLSVEGEWLELEVTRTDFERLCDDLFQQILKPVEGVLQNSGLSKAAIHDVLMVGGSSKIPKVRELLGTFLNKTPYNGVDPLTAVVRGATIIAAKMADFDVQDIRQLEFHECVGLAIGIQVGGGVTSTIFAQGVPLPQKRTKTYVTRFHNQQSIALNIIEGPWEVASKNRKLGTVTVLGIPPGEAGQQSVELVLSIDEDGVLTASAKSTHGTEPPVTLMVEKTGHLLTDEQVRIRTSQWAAEKEKDHREAQEVRRKTKIGDLVENVRTFMENESKRSLVFEKTVSVPVQQGLISLLQRWLPDQLHRTLTDAELTQAEGEAISVLGSYWKGNIPSWLRH
jgi:molecular chaperone DnaK (HSP70)